MNKIIPILCLIFAGLSTVVAIIGIITVCIALSVPEVAIVAVPVAIVGGVISGMSTAVTAMFFRDRLCKISFFINVAALVISIVSIVIWLAAL